MNFDWSIENSFILIVWVGVSHLQITKTNNQRLINLLNGNWNSRKQIVLWNATNRWQSATKRRADFKQLFNSIRIPNKLKLRSSHSRIDRYWIELNWEVNWQRKDRSVQVCVASFEFFNRKVWKVSKLCV